MDAIICYRNDADWQAEAESAQKYFPSTGNRMTIKHGQLVIPRFSALPFFKEFEEEMLYINCRLINSYNQHRYIADLGNWYYDLHEFTPMTWKNLYELPEDKSFILKGETNSRKFLWKTHCFAENKQDAIRVHTNLTNDSLIQYQQIYIRANA